MFKSQITIKILLVSTISFTFCSCNKEPLKGGVKPVPTTYNFSNVNYSGQVYRQQMLIEMIAELKKGNVPGVLVSASLVKDMFANTNSPFTDSVLNNSGKQLKNKCYSLDQAFFESLIDSVSNASQSLVSGGPGVAGVVTSNNDPTKKYLFSSTGIEYTQVISKGLMGAVFYYQAVDNYLTDNGIGNSVDNNTVMPGEGTAMQHHWDEAFGYLNVPIDFPTNTNNLEFWSEYCNELDGVLGTNKKLMEAFIKGRWAIDNKQYTVRDDQAAVIRDTWELLVAACVIHELNEAKASFADDALRNHLVSEAIGFIYAMKYKTDKKISQTQIDQALQYLGYNLYTISLTNINNTIDLISSIYGFDTIKNSM